MIRLVAPTGMTKKRPTAKTSDSAIVIPHIQPPIGSGSSSPSSGSIWALAEIPNARKPIRSDSASATTPRITGQRSTRCRLAQETSGSEITSICSSGLADGHRPGRDAAHHHALEHRLAADGRVAARHR